MQRYYLKDLLIDQLGEGYKIVRKLYGGMMNISYLVEDEEGSRYIVYIPNGKANKTVDRVIEKENTKIVESLNLTSETIYFDTKRGIKIKRYIEGNSLNNIKDEEIDYQKVSDLLHCIHDSYKLAPNDYRPFDRLAIYENRALKYAPETYQYRKLKDFLSLNIEHLLNKHKVFSHNDFQKSNVLKDENGNYYVIDFEFCGNNDEVYDIATYANGSLEEGEKLLEVYFNNKVPASARRRFYLWRIFISLQWNVVAVTKHYQGEGKNTGVNFLAVGKHFLRIAEQAQEKYIAFVSKK